MTTRRFSNKLADRILIDLCVGGPAVMNDHTPDSRRLAFFWTATGYALHFAGTVGLKGGNSKHLR